MEELPSRMGPDQAAFLLPWTDLSISPACGCKGARHLFGKRRRTLSPKPRIQYGGRL